MRFSAVNDTPVTLAPINSLGYDTYIVGDWGTPLNLRAPSGDDPLRLVGYSLIIRRRLPGLGPLGLVGAALPRDQQGKESWTGELIFILLAFRKPLGQ
jgi:hypothetical protein